MRFNLTLNALRLTLFTLAYLSIFLGEMIFSVVKADHIRPYPDPSVILVPPPKYDPRILGIPRSTVYYIPHARMYAVCSRNGTNPNIGPRVLACAMPRYRRIYLPTRMTIPLRNAVLRHERGHIWGWKHVNTTGGTENQAINLDDTQPLYEDDLHRHEGE